MVYFFSFLAGMIFMGIIFLFIPALEDSKIFSKWDWDEDPQQRRYGKYLKEMGFKKTSYRTYSKGAYTIVGKVKPLKNHEESMGRNDAMNEVLCKKLIGATREEAEQTLSAMNVSYRYLQIDDDTFMVTMDYNPNRINLRVSDNIITDATLG